MKTLVLSDVNLRRGFPSRGTTRVRRGTEEKQTSGKLWTEFKKDKDPITLKGLTGQVAETAQY